MWRTQATTRSAKARLDTSASSLTVSNDFFQMRLTGPSGSSVVVEAWPNLRAWPLARKTLSNALRPACGRMFRAISKFACLSVSTLHNKFLMVRAYTGIRQRIGKVVSASPIKVGVCSVSCLCIGVRQPGYTSSTTSIADNSEVSSNK
jgi:hypothetical protein